MFTANYKMILCPQSTVINMGDNIYQTTMQFADLVNEGSVFAFENNPLQYHILLKHKSTFGAKIFPFVVQEGSLDYLYEVANLQQSNFTRLRLIQILVCKPLTALQAFKTLLEQFHPVVITEITKEQSIKERIQLRKYLESLGYKIFILDDTQELFKVTSLYALNIFFQTNYRIICLPLGKINNP